MKLKLGAKLALGFGVVLALMALSAGLSYFKSANIREDSNRITQLRIPNLDAARRLADDLDYGGNKARQAILAGTQPSREADAVKAYNEAWDRASKDMGELSRLEPGWTAQKNKDRFGRLEEALPKVRAAQDGAIKTANSGGPDAVVRGGNQYTDEATPAVNAATDILKQLAESFEQLIEQDSASLAAANSSMFWTLVVTTIVALAVGIFVALLMGRQISRATHSVLGQAEAIAAGDLTHGELKVFSEDEIGDLTKAIRYGRAYRHGVGDVDRRRFDGDVSVGTLYYKLNNWVSFAYEQSLYRTRADTAASAFPLFMGEPQREWKDFRSEGGTIFTF